jgi:hypothetical protein
MVLAMIYDRRQTDTQQYVEQRTMAYNARVMRSNKWRRWMPGVQPKMLLTPFGMELRIKDELETLAVTKPQAVQQHPMIRIARKFHGLEEATKDTMIQCQVYDDVVLVPSGFIREVSGLGLPLDFAAKPKFGFHPDK